MIVSIVVFSQPKNYNLTQTPSTVPKELTPVNEITHGHGLAVDVADPSKVYIATHHGLLVLINEKGLFRVGEKEDDYMGFSPHPKDANVFFTSGHSSSGGNLGFQKSDDGGFTWKKISDGVQGPVDFHAMAVSPVNFDLIFGWYQGNLQRTIDGGKNWEIVQNTQFPIVGLTADTKDENIVYASSPQGLFVSQDKGSSFDRIFEGFVSAVAIDPSDSQYLLLFSKKQGLAKSTDAGRTWETTDGNFAGETPLVIAFNNQNPEILYTLTEKNSLYKSLDGGKNWIKIL